MKQLDAAPDENIRHGLVARLVGTFDIAHKHKLSSADAELRKFAFETMTAVLKRQQGQYRNTVTAPLNVVAEALRPKFALKYIVERLEQYPQRLEISWDSGWNVFGYELARRRQEASDGNIAWSRAYGSLGDDSMAGKNCEESRRRDILTAFKYGLVCVRRRKFSALDNSAIGLHLLPED
jgi:hypothetical protein